VVGAGEIPDVLEHVEQMPGEFGLAEKILAMASQGSPWPAREKQFDQGRSHTRRRPSTQKKTHVLEDAKGSDLAGARHAESLTTVLCS
jgi:hypothetical protein